MTAATLRERAYVAAYRGLLESGEALRFVAGEISRDTYLNAMDQHPPYHRASTYPGLAHTLTREPYREALALAWQAGLKRLDHRLKFRRGWV